MLLVEGDILTSPKGRYQIQGKIGSESSFGAVFKALDGNGEPVVVKQMLGAGRIARHTDLDPEYARATFRREADILVSHNHPRIVRGIEFFEREEELFLVMEFINGEDLDQVLIKRLAEEGGQPFSESEVVQMGVSLCGIIHAIHQLPGQVLYRDLKPRNVMWDAAAGEIKLIDFGTARFMDEGALPTRALGTPGYAPPEFYSTTEALSFASDVYTIGATLYELLTGEVAEPLMTPSSFHGFENSISRELQGMIRRAMAQDPRDRYQTAADMGEALSGLDAGQEQLKLSGAAGNPFPYLSCLCTRCGAQPNDDRSVFCSNCGGKIEVIFLRIMPRDDAGAGMDLFLDKQENLIGRLDMDEQIFPDVDLSRFDPSCFVSRRHCVLRRKEARFYLEPLKTTNETSINGYVVSPGRAVEIQPGASIKLADLDLMFLSRPCVAQEPVEEGHAVR